MIVGGGAIGALCAWELARAGRRVLVIERGDDAGQGWRAAAGMLASQIEAIPDAPLFELAVASRERYRTLAAELKEATGEDIGLWLGGIARVAADEADAAELRNRVGWQRQQGYVCDWLDHEEVRERWPWLGHSLGALWAPHDGAVDPVRVVTAALDGARQLGATVVRDTAVALERTGNRITAVRGTDRYPAGTVVLAAGAWSGRLTGLPRPVSVEPVRGQMVALPWPAGVPRAIVYARHSYVVWRNGEAIAGSTMEHAGFDAGTTPDGIEGILDHAVALCPRLDRRQVLRSWSGFRPGTPDGFPIVGREPAVEGLVYATGHGRNGILGAAITALVVRAMIAGGELPLDPDLAPVAPERFWSV